MLKDVLTSFLIMPLTLARNGFLTYATMRNLNKSDNIRLSATKESLPIRIKQLDLTDDLSVKNTMQSIFSETGRIDVLVNNAAYPLTGAFEDLAMDEKLLPTRNNKRPLENNSIRIGP
jgi:NAD(P)-dependent dehydrogenase (short-subunit alcohol dehydrogenase family)